ALETDRLAAVRSRAEHMTAADLYQEIIHYWLERESERQTHERGLRAFTTDERFAACTALALRMWESKEPTIGLSDLSAEVAATLPGLAERGFSDAQATHSIGSGSLLIRTEEDSFAFVHQSVMEWLVARAAATGVAEIDSPMVARVVARRRMSRLMTEFLV